MDREAAERALREVQALFEYFPPPRAGPRGSSSAAGGKSRAAKRAKKA